MQPIVSTELMPAPLYLRVAAFVIDFAIYVLLTIIIAEALGDEQIQRRETYATLIVVFAAYHIGFVTAFCATPGKIAVGLYIGEANGGRPSPDRVILRFIVKFIGFFVFGVGTTISMVMVVLDAKHRALHDRVAGTAVYLGRPPLA